MKTASTALAMVLFAAPSLPLKSCPGRRFNSLDVGQLEVSGTNIGQTNPWELTAVAGGRAPFEAGLAPVVGLARSFINGRDTDAHHAC